MCVGSDWSAGDLLIVDNMRFVHGRTAFPRDVARELGVMLGGVVDVDGDLK